MTQASATPARQRRLPLALSCAAVALGATLALGSGASMAAFSDTAVGQEMTITSGTLQLDRPGTVTWADISADLPDPVALEGTQLTMVPGDVFRSVEPLTATLAGRNLSAELRAELRGLQGDLAADGLSGEITLVSGDFAAADGDIPAERVVGSADLGTAGTTVLGTLTANDAASEEHFTLITEVAYAATGKLGVSASEVLDGTALTLTQVRAGVDGM